MQQWLHSAEAACTGAISEYRKVKSSIGTADPTALATAAAAAVSGAVAALPEPPSQARELADALSLFAIGQRKLAQAMAEGGIDEETSAFNALEQAGKRLAGVARARGVASCERMTQDV